MNLGEDYQNILLQKCFPTAHGDGGEAGRNLLPYISSLATRKQGEGCYPRFPKFLQLKKKYDPEERSQRDWYRHYKTMFGDQV
jgi:hypothetical protein